MSREEKVDARRPDSTAANRTVSSTQGDHCVSCCFPSLRILINKAPTKAVSQAGRRPPLFSKSTSQHTVREGDAVDATDIVLPHHTAAHEQQQQQQPQPRTPQEHEQQTREEQQQQQQNKKKTLKKMNNGLMMMMQQHLVGVQPAPTQQADHLVMGPQLSSYCQDVHRQQSQSQQQSQQGRRFIGQYELLETLGKGMSGKVKKAQHMVTGERVALKIIDKSKAVKRTLSQLHTEIVALKSLSHPNILQLLHVELDAMYPKKSGEQIPSIVLALQLAEGGELFDFMMYTGSFNETMARTLFRQLLSALQYCHERGVYHRDIKPENLLLDANYQLKIADFGLAAIRADPDELLRTECGTRSYMAPEILNHQEYDGAKADIWSSGVVLFILLAGNPPFQLAKKGDWWFNAVTDGDYDRFWRAHKKYAPHFPVGAQVFLNSIFQPDPVARLSADELLQHEWMQGLCLSNHMLYREMSSRRTDVEREKEREKEKARLEKMQQMAVSGSGGSSMFDPWAGAERRRHRSTDTAADTEAMVADQGGVMAPLLGDGTESLKGFTHFFSALPSQALMERIQLACGSLSGHVDMRGPFKLRCTLPHDGAKVKMDIAVYTLPPTGNKDVAAAASGDGPEVVMGLQVVDVRRKEGDAILFHRLYQKLQSKVRSNGDESHLVDSGSSRDSSTSTDTPPEAEEEAITNEVGMI